MSGVTRASLVEAIESISNPRGRHRDEVHQSWSEPPLASTQ